MDIKSILIGWGPTVLQLVTGAKKQWGASKSGAEKFEAVKNILLGGGDVPAGGAIKVVEGVADKDLVNEANLKGGIEQSEALVNESIELGYQIMKKQERLEEIGRMLRDLKGTGQPLP